MKNPITQSIRNSAVLRVFTDVSRYVSVAAALLCSAQTLFAQPAVVADPTDMADSSGDIRQISAYVKGGNLYLTMTVDGIAAPSVANTPVGMVNRYYYHWLVDTDNNPATGRSNSEYEGVSTGLSKPIGAELVAMIGWRDGKPNGLEVYNPLDEDNPLVTGFPFQARGNTLTAVVPLAAAGLSPGQTVAVSAFQEGASDGWAVDWIESATLVLSGPDLNEASVTDGTDMADSSGDIRGVSAHVEGENLHLSMTVQGVASPSVEQTLAGMVNRYYYHWLVDTDNNPATGRSNSEYEGVSTGLNKPLGAELVIMIGWRDGKPNGLEAYNPLDEDNPLVTGFEFQASGNTLTAVLPLADVGLTAGQMVAVSAFQEGASDGWAVDWIESDVVELSGPATAEALVLDPPDMADSSGDIRRISGRVEGGNLHLTMTVHGIAAPSVDQTVVGMVNRYYYHWLVDADNNPATGRSNSEYEGTSTGLTKPIGAELVVMIGWRDGKPNGLEVYNPLDEDNPLLSSFPFEASGNTLSAVIPLGSIGLTVGQTVGLSAFQEGASDGWAVDWIESEAVTLTEPAGSEPPVASVNDPIDMADSSGDIKTVEGTIEGTNLVLRITVYGIVLPTVEETPVGMVNRYYYHWLLDTDNNPATGRSNSEYEGVSTGLNNPIGADLVVMIGWRNGLPNGVEVYDPADEDTAIVTDFAYEKNGSTVEARIPLEDLGLSLGQTIALSAFQEGASDGWAVDWVESAELTLSTGGNTLTLDAVFAGDAFGFEIDVTDDGDQQVDTASVKLALDGQTVTANVSKTAGVTEIVGQHASLLEANSLHTITLSLKAGTSFQARDFVFKVEPYTVLPPGSRLLTVETTNSGFVVNATSITYAQSGVTSLHTNNADLAEKQLAGEMTDPVGGFQYYNEADVDLHADWFIPPFIAEGVINWHQFAPDQSSSLNFTNDEPIPHMTGFVQTFEGVVFEILAYVELTSGSHKLGLYTEGGHKVNAGLSPLNPVVSLFDNSDGVERAPTYFARNQFFNVVAVEPGYYPLRVLWFQSKRSQEDGLVFELFSVKDRELHLLNDDSDPLALRAYRAGLLLTPGVKPPTLRITRVATGVTLEWTGKLEASDKLVGGTWTEIADESQSPMPLPLDKTMRFLRARKN